MNNSIYKTYTAHRNANTGIFLSKNLYTLLVIRIDLIVYQDARVFEHEHWTLRWRNRSKQCTQYQRAQCVADIQSITYITDRRASCKNNLRFCSGGERSI